MNARFNPLGIGLRQLMVTADRLEELHGWTPEQVDSALTEFQRAYRQEKGIPAHRPKPYRGEDHP